MATAILQRRHAAIVVAPEHHGFVADSAREKLVARNFIRPGNDIPSIQDSGMAVSIMLISTYYCGVLVASQCARFGRGATASKFNKALAPDREPYLVMVAKRLAANSRRS